MNNVKIWLNQNDFFEKYKQKFLAIVFLLWSYNKFIMDFFFDLIVLIQHAYILAFDCFGLISANILIKSFLETFYEKSK